jgi:hypothetical protein
MLTGILQVSTISPCCLFCILSRLPQKSVGPVVSLDDTTVFPNNVKHNRIFPMCDEWKCGRYTKFALTAEQARHTSRAIFPNLQLITPFQRSARGLSITAITVKLAELSIYAPYKSIHLHFGLSGWLYTVSKCGSKTKNETMSRS